MGFFGSLVGTAVLAAAAVPSTAADGAVARVADARVVIDGDLSEWRIADSEWRALIVADPALAPAQKDTSASAAIRFDRTNLYVALKVQDEQRVADATIPWDADSIEVAIDALTDGGERVRSRVLFLPFNVGRRVLLIGMDGRPLKGASLLAGFEVATREVAEGSGSWIIEARLPRRALRIDPAATTLGFELALRDRDGGERSDDEVLPSRVDLSISGDLDGPTVASTLPGLELAGEPVPGGSDRGVASTGLGVAAACAVLILLWGAGKAAKRAGRAAQRRSSRWRLAGLLALALVALLLTIGVDAAEWIATWRAETALLRRGATVGAVLRDLERPELAARLRGAEEIALRELLSGRSLPVAESNRYLHIPVLADGERGPGDYHSLEPIAGVPFSEHGVRLGVARGAPDSVDRLDFVLDDPLAVRRVHLAAAALLAPAARADSGQIVDAIEVQLRFARVPADQVQMRRFTIDDARADPVGHRSANWGRARLRAGPREEPWLASELAGEELRHVDHLVMDVAPPALPAAGEAELLLSRITVAPTRAAGGATIWISGITLELAGPTPRYVPLVLGSADRNGYPMPMRAGRPAPRELRVPPKPGAEPTRTLLWGRADQGALELKKLRLYYRAEGPVLRALADTATLRVRAWVVVTIEGEAEPRRIPLRAGLEIDDAQLYEPQHPASMTSFLASTFETRQGLLHYDGFELPLPASAGGEPLRVTRVEIEQPAESRGALVIAGMSALVRDELPPPPPLETLLVDSGAIRLSPSAATALAEAGPALGFAVGRDGVVRQVGGPLADTGLARLLGTGTPRGDAALADGAVSHERRAGRDLLTVPLSGRIGEATHDVVIFCERPALPWLRSMRTIVAWVASLLALPFLLLLLVDLLSRVARIRTRLSFLFLLTSLAPLAALFVVLFNLLTTEQRAGEERRAAELLSQLRLRVERLCAAATEHSQRLLAELEASELLTARVSDDEVRRRLRQHAASFPDQDVAVGVVVEAPSDDGSARRIHSDTVAAPDPRFDAPHEGLALSSGEVVFSGSAENRRRGLRVRVAGRVDHRALRAVVLEAAADEAALLLSPWLARDGAAQEGGEALAIHGTHVPTDELAREAARELDRGRGTHFVSPAEGGTCGFDLVRTSSGEPVAVLSASVASQPQRIDLGPIEVDLAWFVLALGAVILAASNFLGAVVTDGITRPIARMLRGAVSRIDGTAPVARTGGAREDSDDEVSSLELSFERLWEELAASGRRQALLVDLIGVMARPADLRERTERVLVFVREMVGGRASCCWLVDPLDSTLERVAVHRTTEGAEFPARLDLAEALDWLRERRPRTVAPGDLAGGVPDWAAGGARLLVLPLELGVQVIGLVVVVDDGAEDPLPKVNPALLAGVIGQAAAGIERARLATRSIEDPETGLSVHAYFAARVGEELDRAAHGRRPIAVLEARLELSGATDPERAGEVRRLASLLARELRRICRDREIVGRRGPLEFEVLLPFGGRSRAEEVALQWRERLLEPQHLGPELAASLRVAFAIYPEEARSAEFLFALVRRRLEAAPETEPLPHAEGTLDRFRQRFPEFGFGSARMQPVLRQIEKVAASDATVLIVGETGTGKEVAAQLLHRLGPRAGAAFVAVHCAALPPPLLEAELFGHEKGAFTGADQRRFGRFEQAHGGTLFLDEVGEIPLEVQVKLLRVLQERRVHRLGGREEIAVDVRLIAATHRSLEEGVRRGTFREDLLYRLKVVTLDLPPLRERLDEIPQLVDRFLASKRAADPRLRVQGIEPAALDLLARHPWPGNVRELRNVIERAIVLGEGAWIRRDDVDLGSARSVLSAVGAGGTSIATPASPPASVAVRESTPPSSTPHLAPDPALGTSATTGAAPTIPPSEVPAPVAQARELSRKEAEILDWIQTQGGTVTTKAYSEHSGVSQRTALRELSDLVEVGVLIRDGHRRAARYHVVAVARLRTDKAI
jgi:DNA-binding NtrC family response regulator